MGGGGRGRRRRKSGDQRRGRSRFAAAFERGNDFGCRRGNGRARRRKPREAARRPVHAPVIARVVFESRASFSSPRGRPGRLRVTRCGRRVRARAEMDGTRLTPVVSTDNGKAESLLSFRRGLVPPDPADATEENFQAPEVDFRLGAAAESSRRASARRAHRLSHLGPSRVRKRRASTRAPSSGPSALPRRPASVRERAPSRWLAR
jgi:hypothetical protein